MTARSATARRTSISISGPHPPLGRPDVFPEEAEGNARDTLYRALGERAGTSLAARDPGEPAKYRWDIVLMG